MKRVAVVILLFVGVMVLFSFVNTPQVQASQPETVRIWVEFEQGHKEGVRASLNRAGAHFHYEFDELSSFVVTIPGSALNGIMRNPHVVDVEEDAPRYLIESKPVYLDDIGDPNNSGQIIPYGVDMVQARQLWDSDGNGVVDGESISGEGITVCIIDTGYYSAHEDLTDVNLIGGISQVDDDYQTDGYGHGTHVAGTISAVNNALGVVGVTPGTVDFYIVKYFANDGLYVPGASDLVAAINDCAANGADVINMSLGGYSSNRKEQRAFDNLYAQGVLSIAAAGNESVDDPHYPSAYESVVAVAAIDEDMAQADFSNFGEYIELAAPGVDVLSTIPYIATNTVTVDGVDYTANHIDFSALGLASGVLVDGGLCGTTGNWTGNVVLCQRGDFSFAEKVLNVEASGGVAAVIYNNEPGNFLGTMDPDTSAIVAVSLSQEDGEFLLEYKIGLITEVSASLEWPASGYEAWGGTSMASPHVAGVAALLWSSDPSLTNVQVREAMKESAYDLGESDWDPIFGFGLVQAADALDFLGGGAPSNQLNVEVITDKPEYASRDTAVITVSVEDQGGSHVDGVTVDVTVTTPKGKTYHLTGTTGNNGQVELAFDVFARRDGSGTYQVYATAFKIGYEPGSASTTFTAD